jgi:hypothetical protein
MTAAHSTVPVPGLHRERYDDFIEEPGRRSLAYVVGHTYTSLNASASDVICGVGYLFVK